MKKEMTDERLAELKRNALGILHESRMDFLRQFPFLGSIAMNLELVPVRTPEVETACTDGTSIYFDIAFLSKLSKNDQLFVFGHEVYHTVMMHFMRCEGRDRQIFNLATDMEVNNMLTKDGITPLKGAIVPSMFSFDEGLCAEDYYEMLLNMAKHSKKQVFEDSENDSGSASGSKQFDKHIYKGYDKIDEDGQPKHFQDRYGEIKKSDPDFNPRPDPKRIKKIREMAVAAAQTMERQKGDLPEHIKRLIDGLLEPEISWKEMLAQFATRTVGDANVSWCKPNRRFAWSGTYLPSKDSQMIKIAVGIDTSGSTQCHLAKFLSEIKGIVMNYPAYQIDIIQCDAEIQKTGHYSNDSTPIDFMSDDFKEISGGGGTAMKPIFDYIDLNGLDIDACVIFTDGYIDRQKAANAPQYPVLWVVTDNTSEIEFGEVVKFKDAA